MAALNQPSPSGPSPKKEAATAATKTALDAARDRMAESDSAIKPAAATVTSPRLAPAAGNYTPPEITAAQLMKSFTASRAAGRARRLAQLARKNSDVADLLKSIKAK